MGDDRVSGIRSLHGVGEVQPQLPALPDGAGLAAARASGLMPGDADPTVEEPDHFQSEEEEDAERGFLAMLQGMKTARAAPPHPLRRSGDAAAWLRPGILALGGLMVGCAVSALTLGPAGLLVTMALEAMAFAGGMMVSRAGQQQLKQANRELLHQATHDQLTGLRNRGAILELLEEELGAAADTPLSVIMADVDRFKAVNDNFGHLAGDEVLRAVAARIEACLRGDDTVGRYGGEEILVVLPRTDALQASLVAERIRLGVSSGAIGTHDGPVPVTASLGVADTERVGARDPWVLVRAADHAMYQAKHRGRNRVVVFGSEPGLPPSPT